MYLHFNPTRGRGALKAPPEEKLRFWYNFVIQKNLTKMTKIGIQNPKLIVTNDYQQFLAHFDWFLSIFQISDVKPELLPVKLKVCKNGIFWA